MTEPLHYYASIIGPEPQAFDEFLRTAVDYYNAQGTMDGFAWPQPPEPPAPPKFTGPLYGVDVSHWQGAIDWPKVAACVRPVISFAIIKATEGSNSVDSMAWVNMKGASAAGLHVGLYHFYRPLQSPVEQSQAFVRMIKAAIDSGVNVNWAAIDIEEDMSAYTAAGLSNFLSKLNSSLPNIPVFIYTRANIWNALPAKEQLTFDCPLWVANWVATGENVPFLGASPKVPTAWGSALNWTIWQYTNEGRIDGIKGPVDLNVIAAVKAK